MVQAGYWTQNIMNISLFKTGFCAEPSSLAKVYGKVIKL